MRRSVRTVRRFGPLFRPDAYMRHALHALALGASLVAAAGCGKTECQKYADMEWKCGDYPAKEEDITRQMAEGMCEGAKEMDEDKSGLGAHFKAEAACAKQHPNDCAAYKACTDAAPYGAS